MNANEYQEACQRTAIYREGINKAILENIDYLDVWLGIGYCAGKLNGEAGEVAEEVNKALRDDGAVITAERRSKLFKELGDVCWYTAMLCNELGFKLQDVMDYNLTKLLDRQARGTLQGSGSER